MLLERSLNDINMTPSVHWRQADMSFLNSQHQSAALQRSVKSMSGPTDMSTHIVLIWSVRVKWQARPDAQITGVDAIHITSLGNIKVDQSFCISYQCAVHIIERCLKIVKVHKIPVDLLHSQTPHEPDTSHKILLNSHWQHFVVYAMKNTISCPPSFGW